MSLNWIRRGGIWKPVSSPRTHRQRLRKVCQPPHMLEVPNNLAPRLYTANSVLPALCKSTFKLFLTDQLAEFMV